MQLSGNNGAKTWEELYEYVQFVIQYCSNVYVDYIFLELVFLVFKNLLC